MIDNIVKSDTIKNIVKDLHKEQDLKILNQITQKKKNTKINLAKYTPARNLRDPSKTYLFICEGDSAKNFIDTMLNGSNEYFGFLVL